MFGFWDALFAAPLAGLLQAIGTAAWRELRGGDAQAVARAVVDTETREGVVEKQQYAGVGETNETHEAHAADERGGV